MDRLIGGALGRYQIEAVIGRGGMATVYRATDPHFGRAVAIKAIRPELVRDTDFDERFLREARAIARLHHPNILSAYDFGKQEGIAFLVMPYIAGGTLQDHLRQRQRARLGPPSLAEAVAMLRPMARALDYAHRQGIIHRDVKPNNILLAGEDYPLLADFGIAKVFEHVQGSGPAITVTGAIVGTPEYMSPEQAQGQTLDSRADLYSLSVILYELLTGRPPFRAETPLETPIAIVIRQITTPPPAPRELNPAINPALEGVLLRALAKQRTERYPSGEALFAALDHLLVASPAGNATLPTTSGQPTHHSDARSDLGVTPEPNQERDSGATMEALGPSPSVVPTPPGSRSSWRHPTTMRQIGCGALLVLFLLAGTLSVAALRGRDARVTPTTGTVMNLPAGTAIPASGPLLPLSATPMITPRRETATVDAPVSTGTPVMPALPTVGATPTLAAAMPASPSVPIATRDGRQERILFSTLRTGFPDNQIFGMAPDGSKQAQFIPSRGHSFAPRISPNGKYVVFSSVAQGDHTEHGAPNAAGGEGNHDIFRSNSDGSDIVKLTYELSWDNAWSWSPDSKWVTFSSNRDGNYELYKMTITGEEVTRLTNHAAADGWPSWTPDGKRIVFASDRDGGTLSQIYAMDADGTNVRRLTSSKTYDTYPFVSPDGTKIAYTVRSVADGESEIYVMDINGANVKRLTNTVAAHNEEASWSPDGTRLVFVSDRDGNKNIYTMSVDGTKQIRLTDDPGEDVDPTWGYLQLAAQSSPPERRPWADVMTAALPARRTPSSGRKRRARRVGRPR